MGPLSEWKSEEGVGEREVKTAVSKSASHCSAPGKPAECSHFDAQSTAEGVAPWLTSKPQPFEDMSNQVDMLEVEVQKQFIPFVSL